MEASHRRLLTKGFKLIEYRKLEELKVQKLTGNQYILLKCFTGYGKRSFKDLRKSSLKEPDMAECRKLLDGTRFSLANLLKEY